MTRVIRCNTIRQWFGRVLVLGHPVHYCLSARRYVYTFSDRRHVDCRFCRLHAALISVTCTKIFSDILKDLSC